MLCLWFQALELDQSNEKALFRRGEALFNMNEFDRAKNDFQQVVQLYPANKAAKSQVRRTDITVLQQRKLKKSSIFGSKHDLKQYFSIHVNVAIFRVPLLLHR